MNQNRTMVGVFKWTLWIFLASGGCQLGPVIVDGIPTPRIEHDFAGNPYNVQHHEAHPRLDLAGARGREEGGRISGVICGTDVEFSVEHLPGHTRLMGAVDNQHLAELQIRSTDRGHSIIGKLGPREVRLALSDDAVDGYIGRCPYRLRLDPTEPQRSRLLQFYQAQGERMQAELYGISRLRRMPVADQAAILPMMLLCLTEKVFAHLGERKVPPIGFDGRHGAEPLASIRLEGGVNSFRDCGAISYE